MKGFQASETSEILSKAAANNVAQKCNACSQMDKSPRQSAQAKLLSRLFSSPIQRREEHSESNPGNFPLQRELDEELKEPAQGKFSIQRKGIEELEEPVQKKTSIQGKGIEELEKPVQGKFPIQREANEEEEPVQGKFPIQEKANGISENGLPSNVQAKMESALNTSFSDVNVHPNSSKASDVGALAYTQGNDIHVAPGHYNPESTEGQKLIGHELGHVVQQREGRVQPTGEVAGLPLNDSPSLEHEADQMGERSI